MDNTEQQIRTIEEEMAKTPYHKGTQKWFGKMRAKIARLRARQTERQTKKGSGGGGFGIRKFGDATIVLVGFPSVGKSTLLNKLTNAKSPTAEYAFTTVSVIPGMMNYNGAQIQILDIPGLIQGASSGKGKGREVLSIIRVADLLLIMAEAGKEKVQFKLINKELHLNEVRINEGRPIDGLAPNRVYVPALFVVNKIDQVSTDLNELTYLSERDVIIRISAQESTGLEELKEAIWGKLGLVRVYLRPLGSLSRHLGGGGTNMEALIMHERQKLKDVLDTISREMAQDKTGAKIWGTGAKFPGQTVSLETKVQDEIEVTFV